MDTGWIKVNRQIQDHWLWEDKPFSKGQAWIDLIMLANHTTKLVPYKGDFIECKRGDVNISVSQLARRWGWSRKKAGNYIRALEDAAMVTTEVTTHRTTITIVKYGIYQAKGTTKRQTSDQTKDTAKEQPVHTTKNERKINNESLYINNNNNISSSSVFLKGDSKGGRGQATAKNDLQKEVRDQLEYDIACSRFGKDRMDEVVDIMSEVLASDSRRIRVNREWQPAELVKQKIRSITLEHLGYIFLTMKDSPTEKTNMRSYIITCLFNAPSTMHTYYRDRVARDMKNGRMAGGAL